MEKDTLEESIKRLVEKKMVDDISHRTYGKLVREMAKNHGRSVAEVEKAFAEAAQKNKTPVLT